jgi:hypothetical protein
VGASADPADPACGPACAADTNRDGGVGMDDVAYILAAMGTAAPVSPAPANPAADINGDGGVGLDDAAAALGMVGEAPGPGPDTCGIANPCF